MYTANEMNNFTTAYHREQEQKKDKRADTIMAEIMDRMKFQAKKGHRNYIVADNYLRWLDGINRREYVAEKLRELGYSVDHVNIGW